MNQFKVTCGEFVKPDKAVLLNASQLTDMLRTVVVGLLQVIECRTGSDDTFSHLLDAESLQRGSLELFHQQFLGEVGGEDPVLEGVGVVFLREQILERMKFLSLQHHLCGVEVLQQLVNICRVALGHIELARRHIQERDTVYSVGQMQSAKEVVLLHLQHHIVVRDTRRHQLRDTALHQPFGRLGVFQLLADSHTASCLDQFGEI